MKKTIFYIVLGVITVAAIIFGVYRNVGFTRPASFFGRVITYPFYDDEDKDAKRESKFFGKYGTYKDEQTFDDIDEIKIHADVMSLTIESGSENKISYECNNDGFIPEINVRNGKLVVNQKGIRVNFGASTYKCKLCITLKDTSKIDYLDINSDVGDIFIEGVSLTKLNVNQDVGNLILSGLDLEKGKVNTDVGNIEIRNLKEIDAFDMDVSCSIGSVSYKGKRTKKNFHQKGNDIRSLTINCDVGDIDID